MQMLPREITCIASIVRHTLYVKFVYIEVIRCWLTTDNVKVTEDLFSV